MNIDRIRSEIFKLLSSEKEEVYSSNDLEEKKLHNANYNVFNEYYMLLKSDNTFSYVFNLNNKVLKTVLELEKKYKSLLDKYNSLTNNHDKNNMVNEINYYATRINAYNQIYNIINNNLKSNNSDYTEYSNKVIGVINRINNEKDSQVLLDLEEELYNLNEERRVRLSQEVDSSIIKQICELESLELRIANSVSKSEPYVLNRKEFINSLKTTIQVINEYYFLDYKKSKFYKENKELDKDKNNRIFLTRLNEYVNKYYSLISSIFNDNYYMIEKGNIKMSTDDLINYLCIYNLDKNYEVFRSKNKNKLIGNNDVSKTDYLEKVDLINTMINVLIDKSANKIKDQKIVINDNTSDREELIKIRDRKISEIESIVSKEQIHARK